MEQVVMTVNIALRRTMAQLNYFTEGNIPEALIGCPADWRPAQIREMQELFDDMLRGNLAQRSGAKFVPGGLNVQFTKDALLKDEFDEWLARIICYAFSVPPTAFVRQMNRATADSAQETGLQEGLAPLQNWVKGLVDRVLAEDFAAPDLEFAWNEDRSLSASEAMTVNTGYVAAGLKTRNEVRADLGLPPLPGGDAALVTTGTALVGIGAEVAKYDPNQPRDNHGRWTDEGESGDTPSISRHPLSEGAQARIIPAQVFFPPVEIFPDMTLPDIPSISNIPPGTLIDPAPAIPLPYTIPQGLSPEEKADCLEQWDKAEKDCRDLKGENCIPKNWSMFGRWLEECKRGMVSEKCGGNPVGGEST